MSNETPSQTVGPYLRIGLDRWKDTNVMRSPGTQGQAIRIEGKVFDADGVPVDDAMIEIWQANAAGRYNHPEDTQEKPLDESFLGFGRCPTGEDGSYWFETIKPGQVPGRGNALQAPHVMVNVFARGMLIHATTRLYFDDEAAANELDPVLSSLPEPARRPTLLASSEGGSVPLYRFDIHLQGENETIFFDA